MSEGAPNQSETPLSPELQSRYDHAVEQMNTLFKSIESGSAPFLKKITDKKPFIINFGPYNEELLNALRSSSVYKDLEGYFFRALIEPSKFSLFRPRHYVFSVFRPHYNSDYIELKISLHTPDKIFDQPKPIVVLDD